MQGAVAYKKTRRVATAGFKYYLLILDWPELGQPGIMTGHLLRLTNGLVGVVCRPGQMAMQLGRSMILSEFDAQAGTIGIEVCDGAWTGRGEEIA